MEKLEAWNSEETQPASMKNPRMKKITVSLNVASLFDSYRAYRDESKGLAYASDVNYEFDYALTEDEAQEDHLMNNYTRMYGAQNGQY